MKRQWGIAGAQAAAVGGGGAVVGASRLVKKAQNKGVTTVARYGDNTKNIYITRDRLE